MARIDKLLVLKPRQRPLLLCLLTVALSTSCAATHGGPVIDTGDKPPENTGTISGIVRAAGSNTPLSGRRVIAVDVSTGTRFEASTATNGGYTMKVPVGRYRLQVELDGNESTAAGPTEVVINRSDVDSGRDFLITQKDYADAQSSADYADSHFSKKR
jgi:hypothetical protein